MPRKKKKDEGGGIPEWVVTFGDMMSLLLTFFILLVSFSELKRPHEYQRVVTAVKEAFGYSGGVGVLPSDDPPLRSMIEMLEEVAKQKSTTAKLSEAPVESTKGKQTKVKRVHEGLKFTIGGGLSFEPESAVLLDGAKEELRKVARLLRGRKNKISVRGHAASKVLSPSSKYEDLVDLAYWRAKAVRDFLVHEGELDPMVLVVESRGDTEPLVPRVTNAANQATNRRVEIIMTESMVDDFHPDPNFASEDLARGG